MFSTFQIIYKQEKKLKSIIIIQIKLVIEILVVRVLKPNLATEINLVAKKPKK